MQFRHLPSRASDPADEGDDEDGSRSRRSGEDVGSRSRDDAGGEAGCDPLAAHGRQASSQSAFYVDDEDEDDVGSRSCRGVEDPVPRDEDDVSSDDPVTHDEDVGSRSRRSVEDPVPRDEDDVAAAFSFPLAAPGGAFAGLRYQQQRRSHPDAGAGSLRRRHSGVGSLRRRDEGAPPLVSSSFVPAGRSAVAGHRYQQRCSRSAPSQQQVVDEEASIPADEERELDEQEEEG